MSDPLGLFTQESNDPLGLFAENDDNFATKALKEAGSATSWGSAIPGAAEALTGGVGAMANMAVSGIAGPVKSLFTGKSAADEIGNISHSIEQAIPYMPETDAGKAYLNLLSLPVEGIHKLGEKAFDATGSPLVGAGVETVGNAALLALGARRGKKAKAPDFDTKLKTTMEEKPAPPIDTMQQHELFDQPEMGRVANPYEAKLGDWRVDENGIPIKADLSMDVQNAQNPLQRNLWGDELEQTRSPVGQNASLLDVNGQQEGIPLTQAIDSMDWAHRRGAIKNELTGEVEPTGELLSSINDANRVLPTENRSPSIGAGSQRGAIDPDLLTFGLASKLQKFMENRASKEGPMVSSLKDKQAKIEEIVGKPIFAEPPKAESIVADSLASGKDGKGLNSMEAGSTLTAAKRNSPLVQGVSRTIQHAKNLSEYAIRETVFPVEKKLRKLSSDEIIQLGKVMKAEMFNRRRLSTTELADLGLSEKQLLAYESVREMFSKALERENAAREAQGLKPITENEAYLSSRWKGDFRRAVHDANGKLVWYLAADSKMGLNKQTKALLKEFPDLVVKPNSDHTVRSHVGSNMNAGEMYSTMVDVLGRDDPAVARIQEWVQEQAVNEGRGMLAQEKHFKSKSNVRGFVGDRPSNTFTGKLDPQKEALDLFQEQITYSKNAHKWSGMQEAGQELKKIFSNKELADQQPNNMAYAKDYYRNQIGLSTHKAVAGLEDAIRQTGISPHVLNRGISNVKSLWITQKLAASVGFAASNIIQAANMLPHIADLMVKYGGNPLSAIATGISTGPLMALGHVSIARGEKGFYKFLGVMPKAQGEFLAKAMKYAEDNSVTARSVYDETPIASSFSKMAKVEQIAGKTLTAPETLLRSVSYMTYVEMLKSSGKFKNDLDIFRMAEERVNMSMADYRQGERAMLFDKMGTTGNMMNTLQTFPINFYQQWSWAAREAKKGNPLPAATMFAVQAYVAGAMGIPGFADTDKLWNAVKGFLADHFPGQWDKVKDIDLKQIVLNSVGEAGLYGGLSEQSGVSFTSRASAPAGSEMLTSPLGPYADLGRQAMDVAGMVADPNKQSFAQAAMSVTPTGLQGALETGPLQDQTSVLNEQTGQRVYGSTRNLADRKGMVSRTPEEETIRKWGLRSQREVVEKDAAYHASKLESDSRTVIASLPSKIYNELRNNRTEKAKDLIGLYSRLSGKEITTEQIQNEAMKEYTTAAQRASMNATTIPGMLAIKRLQQIQQQK